jgi:hypothetical protein
MEEKDDIFRFEDFLGGDKIEDLKKMKSNLLKEGLFSDNEDDGEYEEVDPRFNPYSTEEDNEYDYQNFKDVDNQSESIEDDNEDSDDYYKLFKDKSEDFICDIAIEGVNQNDTEVRLIVESDDWTLMFTGEIKNGKCIIPIKKLNILNEGQVGNIKLEVNADGNLFTPWEDRFIVKVSKKVTVNLNESRSNKTNKPLKKELGVKVNVRK